MNIGTKLAVFDYLDSIGEVTGETIVEAVKWSEGMIPEITTPLERVRDICCDVLLVTVDEIEGGRGEARVTTARNAYYYIARELGYTYAEIARLVNREPSNSKQMSAKVRDMIQPGPTQDRYMAAVVKRCEHLLK